MLLSDETTIVAVSAFASASESDDDKLMYTGTSFVCGIPYLVLHTQTCSNR